MRRFSTTVFAATLAIVGTACFAGSASAQHSHHRHDRFHDNLDYRQYQRDRYHAHAHQFPMTPWEHQRLHNALDREAYRDHLRDIEYHRRHDHYVPYRGSSYYTPNIGFGFQNRDFSIYFGR